LLLIGGDGHPSGVPRHIGHLCAALKDIARITVSSDVNHGGYDSLSGARHVTVPGLRSRLNLSHLWRGGCELRALLSRERADIVWLHARLPVVFGRILMALRLWRPAPHQRIAITYHGLPFGPGHRRGFSTLSRVLEKRLLRLCPPLDLVFLTEDQASRMGAAMGARTMARHRVHVLTNCSDLGPLPDAVHAGGPHLAMTGRCGWQKNYPLALRLFAHLPEDFTLTLCGAGTDEKAFRDTAAALLPAEALARVRFAGPLKDVRPVLAEADGYMLTSRYEGLPIGALEAFEAGLPLILKSFEGAQELVARHPMALCLDMEDLAADAARVADLIARYRATRQSAAPLIREAWAQGWSPSAFALRCRALFEEFNGSEVDSEG
jgi:glycosyltransferase involved in cell wall biosynthesis